MARRRHNPTCEEIQAILHCDASNDEKQRLFLGIGLSDVETRGLIMALERNQVAAPAEAPTVTPTEEPAYSEPVRQAINSLEQYTFGVEIECFARRDDVLDQCAQQHVSCTSEGYNHNDNTSHFKLVTDGSLTGIADPVECVSPVLRYNDAGKQKMFAVCSALAGAQAKVNKSCGLHIHIGAEDMTDEQYCNVFVNYMWLSPVIESWLAESRKGARWCKRLSNAGDRILQATTKNGMRVALLNDRYYAVNAEAYWRHRTIEFRQHQGTTEYLKIYNWLTFCIKLTEWSKTHRLTASTAPTSIEGIEFLNDEEKEYFSARAEHFAMMRARTAA